VNYDYRFSMWGGEGGGFDCSWKVGEKERGGENWNRLLVAARARKLGIPFCIAQNVTIWNGAKGKMVYCLSEIKGEEGKGYLWKNL